MIWTKSFWKGLAERAVKTFAQSGVATAVIGVTGNAAGITDINWLQVLSVAALATVLSAVTSIGNADFTAGTPKAITTPSGGPMTPGTFSQ